MDDVQIIKPKTNTPSAEQVLVENGFTILSPWIDDNRFEKDGIVYKLAYPVWHLDAKGNFSGVLIEPEATQSSV